ncbi:MAG: dipeptide epimerase [Bacteroidetes bacterium]|nr:dipeptide epimerase [Bacteroidota bacterium]
MAITANNQATTSASVEAVVNKFSHHHHHLNKPFLHRKGLLFLRGLTSITCLPASVLQLCRVLQLHSFPAALPFQYPFITNKGAKSQQQALLVALNFGRLVGWGEAPVIDYYGVSMEGLQASLQQARQVIERYSLQDPQRFWHFLEHLIPEQNFLIAALDIAGWDLFSRLRNKPLYQMLGFEKSGPFLSDYTLGFDSAEMMLRKMKEHPASVYKVKLRRPEEVDLLRSLRSATRAPFRVDLNEGWNYEDTLRLLPELESLGVVMLEQPLPKTQWEEMRALKAQSSIPLFADEACVEEQDVTRCADTFHGINIKLTKCGGITPARRMIVEAKQRGLRVMLGSMNESSIGTSALLHLAPAVDFLDADGPLLLASDYAEGLPWTHVDGQPHFLSLPEAPGLGVSLRKDWQQHLIQATA